ncbi:MAG TPA: Ppx/GppA phosphatase family protein [Beijerinckiaceae bacterium]|nr:Ppx/GppA phosphatase family protein [Beijerinckiaceae bacterium]
MTNEGHPLPRPDDAGRDTVYAGPAGLTPAGRPQAPVYAALDLGTNNCRLLIARPSPDGFKILDAFSRIVRLGERLSHTGRLGEPAIARTLAALAVCREKMEARGVARTRLIATEACRAAENGPAFLSQVHERLGLQLEVVDRETEAFLAAAGCASLADPRARAILLFDIGGGSTEIVWLADCCPETGRKKLHDRVRLWTSLPLGVVSLAEQFGGHEVTPQTYQAMVDHVAAELADFAEEARSELCCEHFHLLGTSGTVTTVAGVHLGLQRYDRRRVDGLWMRNAEVNDAITHLRDMTYDERAANGCIGAERADLVLAGCAIFDAIRQAFPSCGVRIADRGLREGLLMQMMSFDGVWRGGQNGSQNGKSE